jgi:hypothetical protein
MLTSALPLRNLTFSYYVLIISTPISCWFKSLMDGLLSLTSIVSSFPFTCLSLKQNRKNVVTA